MSTVTGSPVNITAGAKLIEPWFDGYQWQEELAAVRSVDHVGEVTIIYLTNPWRSALVKLNSETINYVESE